jgi:hypothetical protein
VLFAKVVLALMLDRPAEPSDIARQRDERLSALTRSQGQEQIS